MWFVRTRKRLAFYLMLASQMFYLYGGKASIRFAERVIARACLVVNMWTRRFAICSANRKAPSS